MTLLAELGQAAALLVPTYSFGVKRDGDTATFDFLHVLGFSSSDAAADSRAGSSGLYLVACIVALGHE